MVKSKEKTNHFRIHASCGNMQLPFAKDGFGMPTYLAGTVSKDDVPGQTTLQEDGISRQNQTIAGSTHVVEVVKNKS